MSAILKTRSLVLLYDGTCGVCNKAVQFIIRHDRQRSMLFAAVQSRFGMAVRARHPELEGIDSIVLVEKYLVDERVFFKSDAALRVAGYLGGAWRLFLIGYVVPRAIRDFFYDEFAKRRYKWFGKYDPCLMPDGHVRARFLDLEERSEEARATE